MKNLQSRYSDMPALAKLFLLLLIVMISLLSVSILASFIAFLFLGSDTFSFLLGAGSYDDMSYIAFLKYMQIMSHIGLFIIPAFIFAKIFENGVKKFYFSNARTSIPLMLMGSFIIILMLPFVVYLGEINEKMVFPQIFQGLESWMQSMESKAEELTMLFLSVETIGGLFLNLFMIAIIPAIGEELIFRGVIMKKFEQLFRNVHIAVFVSAIIFSAFHLQFYGFLPRFYLGLLLGYMYVWTGNLIIPIVVHFANNAFAVVAYYLSAKGLIQVDIEHFGSFSEQPLILMILIAIAFVALFYFWKICKLWKRNQSIVITENNTV
jgi:membrane protease YdiL (CAAX protease family)